jgi:hypothetical protein
MLEDHQPAVPDIPQSPVEPPAGPVPADPDAAPDTVPAPGHAAARIRRFASYRRQWLTSEPTRLKQELQARRQRSGMVDAGFLVQELDARVGGGILAGALAFRIFLFMVPVVYVIFTALGVASRALGHDPAQLATNACPGPRSDTRGIADGDRGGRAQPAHHVLDRQPRGPEDQHVRSGRHRAGRAVVGLHPRPDHGGIRRAQRRLVVSARSAARPG